MRRTLTWLLLLAISLAVAGVATADAAPLRVDRIADGAPVMTDGSRFAVDLLATGASVRDTRTGRRFTLARPQPACRVGAVNSGLLLWTCPGSDAGGKFSVPHVVDLATRRGVAFAAAAEFRKQTLAPPPTGIEGAGLLWVEIGRQWVMGATEPFYHGDFGFKFNWRTGQASASESMIDRFDDLDSATGSRPLCAPIRNTDLDDLSPPSVHVAGGWTFRRIGYDGTVLQRCGAASGLFLSDVAAYALTPRRAVWVAGSAVRVRDLRTGRVRSARLPSLGRYDIRLAVTDTFAYVANRSQSPARRWRIRL